MNTKSKICKLGVIALVSILLLLPSRLMAEDWSWLQTEQGKYVRAADSSDIDYYSYKSHPQYRVSSRYFVFDNQGKLVYSHLKPVLSLEDMNVIISKVLMNTFNKDKAKNKLPKDVVEEIETGINQIVGYKFQFLGYGETSSTSMNYISEKYDQVKEYLKTLISENRISDNSFMFCLGDYDTIRYKVNYSYESGEPFKVKTRIDVEEVRIPVSNSSVGPLLEGTIASSASDKDLPAPPPPRNGKGTFTVAEKQATFDGNINQWLSKNLHYPIEDLEHNIQGRVVVSFFVEKDGSISDVSISESVSPGIDGEALRVVRSMPKWIPGTNNGVPVRQSMSLPLTFRFQ